MFWDGSFWRIAFWQDYFWEGMVSTDPLDGLKINTRANDISNRYATECSTNMYKAENISNDLGACDVSNTFKAEEV